MIDLGYVGGKRKRKTWYRKTRKEEVKAPRTVESYTQMIESHIIPEIGRIRIGKLAPKDVQGMMSRKKAAGLSARTVNYLRAILRSAPSSAVKQQIIARNVASFTESSRGEKREPRPFTIEETKAFFDAVYDDRHEVAYVIAGTYGLRRGEVLGLRWSDVDDDEGVFHVRQQVQRVEGKDRILPLRTKSSRRTLPLTRSVREALERRRAHQAQERMLAGDRWQETGLVITSSIGTALNPGNFYNRYKEMLEEIGLEGHNLHDLRHTATTLLVRQGVHPRVAMEILGHSQISVTMDVYAHVVGDSVRDAFSSIEGALGGEK